MKLNKIFELNKQYLSNGLCVKISNYNDWNICIHLVKKEFLNYILFFEDYINYIEDYYSSNWFRYDYEEYQ